MKCCLACGENNLKLCFDLGLQPLANDYKTNKDDIQHEYPLAVNVCKDCFHVQLTEFIDPDLMFKYYHYMSGVSKTYIEYLENFALFSIRYHGGNPKNALDIGCNDGTQLDAFKTLGLTTYGADPSENIYEISSKKGHEIFCGYFEDYKTTNTFDIINAAHVFAHNRDPYNFLIKLKTLMNDDTVCFIQTSQSDMIKNNEYDTIYHEHINFFNVKSMLELTKRVGITLIDVMKNPIHGNSFIFILKLKGEPLPSVAKYIEQEQRDGLYNIDTYNNWAHNCINRTNVLKDKCKGLVIGYGAPAKGNTMLNFSHIRPHVIIDDNPLKQNKFTPGSSIPIVPSRYLLDIPSDTHVTFVVLAWNFIDEIKSKIFKLRGHENDTFITY